MSAICGICHADGSFIDRVHFAKMLSIVDYRGPEGEGAWQTKNIALGHRLLLTTPESVNEKQPWSNGRGLWITADCRIDNREELEEKFHHFYGKNGFRDAPDVVYILLAYEIWREEMPKKLLGDFAFAIWDSRRQILFCARDPLGVKPFHYFWDGKRFIFGSEIKQIFCDPEVPRTLNEAHLADWLLACRHSREETCYQAVRRLAPGHSLKIQNGHCGLQSYWDWDPNEEPLSNVSLVENAEKFGNIFREAVRSRLRRPATHRAGSLLSGGLDSSSVTAMAASLMNRSTHSSHEAWPVFTLLFPEANPRYQYQNKDPVDERPYWEPLVKAYGLTSNLVEMKGGGALQNLKEHFWHEDNPLYYPNFAAFQHLLKEIRKSGVRILLHGGNGDELFIPGSQCVFELLKRGEWEKFLREIRGRNFNLGISYGHLFWMTFRALIPNIFKIPYRRFKKTVPDWINPVFAKRIALRDRLRKRFTQDPESHRSSSYGILSLFKSGDIPYVLEACDRMAAASQIEIRSPFLDLRLLQFMAAVPWNQKVREGTTKLLLRESLKKILPPQILGRPRKAEFTPVIRSALEIYAEKEIRQVFEKPHPFLRAMIRPERVKRLYETFVKSPQSSYKLAPSLTYLWYLVSVDQWLKFRDENI